MMIFFEVFKIKYRIVMYSSIKSINICIKKNYFKDLIKRKLKRYLRLSLLLEKYIIYNYILIFKIIN